MSLGIGVLAIDGWTEVSEVLAMVDRCHARDHAEGDLDPRIVGFYERLRARFPDGQATYADSAEDPWMSTPLDVGIDHVFMLLSFSARSDPALEMIHELAVEYGLTIWDPQEASAYRAVRTPERADVVEWWGDLIEGRCTREEIHERVRPWVEDTAEALGDPITSMGLQYLHGFAQRTDEPDVRATFEHWLTHAERFDADPDGWRRDRYIEALSAIRRDQGPQRARALAHRFVARDWLSAEDVTRTLGPAR